MLFYHIAKLRDLKDFMVNEIKLDREREVMVFSDMNVLDTVGWNL